MKYGPSGESAVLRRRKRSPDEGVDPDKLELHVASKERPPLARHEFFHADVVLEFFLDCVLVGRASLADLELKKN